MAGLLWCLFLALSMGTAHCTSLCISLTVPGCNCSQMPLWQCNLDKCVQSKALLVSGCELSGTIPPAIGEQKFKTLDLSYNQLTGAIPSFLKETSIAIPTFFSEPGINQSNLYGCTPVCYVCMLACLHPEKIINIINTKPHKRHLDHNLFDCYPIPKFLREGIGIQPSTCRDPFCSITTGQRRSLVRF